MNEQNCAYFFSTDLVWWALHVFSSPFENLNSGEIVERVDEFSYRLEDLGEWFIDEGDKTAKSFLINGEWRGIFGLKEPQQEKAATWINSIETLSSSVPLDEPTRWYYLFYLECAWLISIFDAYDEFVQGLNVPDLVASYLAVREQFQEQREWLQAQLQEIRTNHLPQDRMSELTGKTEELIERLTADWRATVFSFAQKRASP